MTFRWQGRNLFLTYSQTNHHDATKENLLAFITGLGRSKPVFVLVGRERHRDGGTHFHVFLHYERRFSFTNERKFDWLGYHPNISTANNPTACVAYCSKDEDTITSGDLPDFDAAGGRESRNELWGRLLDEATSPGDFLQRVREAAPYDFATKYQQLEAMASVVFKRREPFQSDYCAEDFTLPDTICEWLEKDFDPEVSFLEIALPSAGGDPPGWGSARHARRDGTIQLDHLALLTGYLLSLLGAG